MMKLQCGASSSKPPVHRRFHTHVVNSSQLPPLRSPKSSPQPMPKPPPRPFVLNKDPLPLQFQRTHPHPLDSSPPPPPPPSLESSPRPFQSLINTLSQAFDENPEEKEAKIENLVAVEYYDPKPGDLVVGVVLSGSETKLDISIGADLLGSMMAKEALPFCNEDMNLLVDDHKDLKCGNGKIGIVRDEDGFREKDEKERPTLEAGTVIFAQVLGRTLSGRPLLSSRRWFRQISWHRARQIMQLNKPIEITILEWNTGGLLTRIEGLRAFLPKKELVNKVDSFTELKNNVGKRMQVNIIRVDEATHVIIISEKQAWDLKYLKPGTLLQGTVSRIHKYGAQIKIGDTTRSGLLHISNISKERVSSVNDVLKLDEEVKVLVIKSLFDDKIFLSIALLESEPGLFLSNKQKVYEEAEEMARKYRKRFPDYQANKIVDSESEPVEAFPFDNEELLYSNWKWFKFEHNDV